MDARKYIERCRETSGTPGSGNERPMSKEVASGVFMGGVMLFVLFLVLYLLNDSFNLL